MGGLLPPPREIRVKNKRFHKCPGPCGIKENSVFICIF